MSGYIEDNGANNRAERGHRRWCLNDVMGVAGFGQADGFHAMHCMDSSGRGVRDSWGYPGKGWFPLSWLHGTGWSLHLKESAPHKSKLTVEVYRLEERPAKAFGRRDEIPGEKLPVPFVSTYLNTIIFEPQNGPVKEAGCYWVRITGGGLSEHYLVELF